MAPAVNLRFVTAAVQVQFRASPCGICGGQSGTGTGPPPPPSLSLHQCPVPIVKGMTGDVRGCSTEVLRY
jgi:hypothetical protein